MLPMIAFLFGLVPPLSLDIPHEGVTVSFIMLLLAVWLLSNILTVIFLGIYFYCRKKQRRNKQLDERKVQDCMETKKTEEKSINIIKIISIILLALLLLTLFIFRNNLMEFIELLFFDSVAYKPVIYLYPEEETDVAIKLDIDGQLTHVYPAYNGGWQVTARPDGTLTDPETGREYYCLFWEGQMEWTPDLSTGAVVAGGDTQVFLEESLAQLGLSDKEANEFIIYWLPQMENNAYNLISFQFDAYTDAARLEITPAPDSLLRVFMTWKALDAPVEIPEQQLPAFDRTGFAVVEWGGTEIK